MTNNVTREDLASLRFFLGQAQGGGYWEAEAIPRLTNGAQVRAFEAEFAGYIGTKYACMVNSGASANVISMAALREIYGPGEVAVPTITWVSDITAVLQAGLTPRFVDVNPLTLGMALFESNRYITDKTIAIFPTHVLGFDAFEGTGPGHLEVGGRERAIIEDCCEALGGYGRRPDQSDPLGRKLGTLGLASNFSFYYAHHMTTVEGGMICTSDRTFYETCRMLRGHGLLRECDDADYREKMAQSFPDLDPQFIFMMAGYNMRPTEIQAVLGRAQLKRLNQNVAARSENLRTFLSLLDPARYRTRYRLEGSSNYALPLILQEKEPFLLGRVLGLLQSEGVEYRRGTAGGGNQLRQPYARKLWGDLHTQFPHAEHIHDFGLYVGNYPDLKADQIEALCLKLNAL